MEAGNFLGSFGLELLTLICLIFFNAFFVLAEFAIVKVRTSRIQELAESGHHRALLVSKIQENLDSYLSVTQLGITAMSIAIGWIGEPAVAKQVREVLLEFFPGREGLVHGLSLSLSFLIIIFFQIVVGEIVPRGVSIRNAERTALAVAPALVGIRKFIRPFLIVFDFSAQKILRLFGIRTGTKLKERLTEEELRMVLIESISKGSMADAKVDLIDNVFDFSKKTAKQVMITRDNIVSLDTTNSSEANLEKAKMSGHTRYPLCDGGIDQIIGLVNFKDVLWQSEESRETLDFNKIRREILFVPESKPLSKLLKDFQKNKIHMAIVIDEFALTVGLVTLEDVLEELVGEIQDEYDQEASPIQLLRDGTYLIDGSITIEEVEEKLGISIEKANNTTIGGAIMSKLGRLPLVGDSVDFGTFKFIVKSLKGRRIHSTQAIKTGTQILKGVQK